MNNLPTKNRKKDLNIIQKIRLAIFKRRDFSMERYIKAPDYIKRDDVAISWIIYNPVYCTEKNLLQIPPEKLEAYFDIAAGLIDVFSMENQLKFVIKNPKILKCYSSSNELVDFLDFAIMNEKYNIVTFLYDIEKKEYLRHLQEKGDIDNVLPKILRYLGDGIIYNIIKEKPDLLKYLDVKKQIEIAEKNMDYLKYVDDESQLNYVKEHKEYIKYASDIVQEKLIIMDKNNLKMTSDHIQLEIIKKYTNAYKYASDEIQEKIWNSTEVDDYAETAMNILYRDIRNSKYFYRNGDIRTHEHRETRRHQRIYSSYLQIFSDTKKDKSWEKIKEFFIHSKLLSAKGMLVDNTTILHDMPAHEGGTEEIDRYSSKQLEIIQNLNLNEIRELVLVDNNYVLAYLANIDKGTYYTRDIKFAKERCENLFSSIFGQDKLMKIKECIDIIDKLQNEKKESTKIESWGPIESSGYWEKKLEMDNIPLNHVKILFNKEIMTKNSEKDIQEYFRKLYLGQDNSEEFKKLIGNAYGSRALDILDSRPGLDVHTINSLEVFDERIIENFGEAFVHDLISYNIRDFSEFLEVIKDEDKLQNFKIYYEVLTKIMGNNVETMQKAITEYYYNEEIIEQTKNIELTEQQYNNLISVLCSQKNIYNINTLLDLQNYDNISNKVIKEELGKARKIDMRYKEDTPKNIKNVICKYILGLNYIEDYALQNYGESLQYLGELYNISTEKENSERYTNAEIDMLEFINFIDKENDISKLLELTEELLKEKGIKNPIAMYNAIAKMKENQIEILNNSFLTVEKMEELSLEEEKKEDPTIIKEEEEGITKYILRGVNFKFLLHDESNFPRQKLWNYEGQLGNNAICARLVSEKNITSRTFW